MVGNVVQVELQGGGSDRGRGCDRSKIRFRDRIQVRVWVRFSDRVRFRDLGPGFGLFKLRSKG